MKESFYTDSNSFSFCQIFSRSGTATNSIVNEIIEFMREIVNKDSRVKDFITPQINTILRELSIKDWQKDFTEYEKSLIAGHLNIIGGWIKGLG